MLRSLAVASVLCAVRADSTWGPADSVHALDGAVVAMGQLVNLPHLSAKQLEDAKRIAADIKTDVEAVESGKLSKDEAHRRVGEGLHELQAFEKELEQPENVAKRMQDLKSKLADKENALHALEKQMQVLKLKKELVEKKLALQKLLAAKQGASKEDSAQEAASMAALGKELEAASHLLGGAEAAKALKAVKAEELVVQQQLAHLDEGQKKSEVMLKAALQGQIAAGTGGAAKSDALAKGQGMLKELEKRERRKFAKTRAQEQVELNGLREAEASLEKKDAAGLKAAISKIEEQGKSMQAKSGKFLY